MATIYYRNLLQEKLLKCFLSSNRASNLRVPDSCLTYLVEGKVHMKICHSKPVGHYLLCGTENVLFLRMMVTKIAISS